ncbi:ArnT family glycosyltransferase [Thermodesulfobacteriota bacterium]
MPKALFLIAFIVAFQWTNLTVWMHLDNQAVMEQQTLHIQIVTTLYRTITENSGLTEFLNSEFYSFMLEISRWYPPLFHTVAALCRWTIGDTVEPGALANFLLFGLLIFAVFLIGVKTSGTRNGLIAAWIIATMPGVFAWTPFYTCAFSQIPMISLVFLLILSTEHFSAKGHSALLGIVLGLTSLTRRDFVLCAGPMMALAVTWSIVRARISGRTASRESSPAGRSILLKYFLAAAMGSAVALVLLASFPGWMKIAIGALVSITILLALSGSTPHTNAGLAIAISASISSLWYLPHLFGPGSHGVHQTLSANMRPFTDALSGYPWHLWKHLTGTFIEEHIGLYHTRALGVIALAAAAGRLLKAGPRPGGPEEKADHEGLYVKAMLCLWLVVPLAYSPFCLYPDARYFIGGLVPVGLITARVISGIRSVQLRRLCIAVIVASGMLSSLGYYYQPGRFGNNLARPPQRQQNHFVGKILHFIEEASDPSRDKLKVHVVSFSYQNTSSISPVNSYYTDVNFYLNAMVYNADRIECEDYTCFKDPLGFTNDAAFLDDLDYVLLKEVPIEERGSSRSEELLAILVLIADPPRAFADRFTIVYTEPAPDGTIVYIFANRCGAYDFNGTAHRQQSRGTEEIG